MILKTQEFKNITNALLLAVSADKNAGNLELVTQGNKLYLNVTNKEYYVSCSFDLSSPEVFRAVVDASLFLDLVSGISTDTFEIVVDNNIIKIKVGKSSYKLPMIFENDTLLTLPTISINNKTVEMTIGKDILDSILNVNSREIAKVKGLDVNELQRLYYIDENGCFTFTTGACLNRFTLEKPVKLLLNDRIVKLFKLFKEDVKLSMGFDAINADLTQTKVVFETDNIYLAAITTCNDLLLNKIQGPCNATKRHLDDQYSNKLVLSIRELSEAVSRLMMFTKNSIAKVNMLSIPVTINIGADSLIMADSLGNEEVISIKNDSVVDIGYSMIINLADLKAVLDSCREDSITMNCGNHFAVVLNRGTVQNLIPEGQKN